MRLALGLALVLAACDAYSPGFDNAPFLCGQSEPRCPKDFTCVTQDAGPEVCQRGGGGLSCADDSAREPNDTLGTASAVEGSSFAASGLSICPAGDRDTFVVEIATAGKRIDVTIDATPGGATLDASILNTGGVPIARASQRDGNQLAASAADLAPGTYYVQVFGPADGVNNYAATIAVTGP